MLTTLAVRLSAPSTTASSVRITLHLIRRPLQLTLLPPVDLPMARVKFNASADYAYLDNFKILSNAFRKHHVDRPIPVEQLVKCKMQDNLEFLQWTKRFWDQHYPGTPPFLLTHLFTYP
jgi:hypothetical protein